MDCQPPLKRVQYRTKIVPVVGTPRPWRRGRGVPRESLEPPEALSQEGPCQVASGQLLSASYRTKYRACRMRRAPVLKSRCCRLVSDEFGGRLADQPAEIARVVRDHPQERAHLIGPEAVAGEAGPVGGGFALFDPLLRRPALLVEADDGPVRPGEVAISLPRGRDPRE